MKGVGLLKKLQSMLPRSSLLTISKSFMRPHLGYGNDIIEIFKTAERRTYYINDSVGINLLNLLAKVEFQSLTQRQF